MAHDVFLSRLGFIEKRCAYVLQFSSRFQEIFQILIQNKKTLDHPDFNLRRLPLAEKQKQIGLITDCNLQL